MSSGLREYSRYRVERRYELRRLFAPHSMLRDFVTAWMHCSLCLFWDSIPKHLHPLLFVPLRSRQKANIVMVEDYIPSIQSLFFTGPNRNMLFFRRWQISLFPLLTSFTPNACIFSCHLHNRYSSTQSQSEERMWPFLSRFFGLCDLPQKTSTGNSPIVSTAKLLWDTSWRIKDKR